MVHIERAVTPVAERRRVYDALYRQYVDLYPAARATMHALAALGS
jgi:sugar (pentulose or hexulose) kinase